MKLINEAWCEIAYKDFIQSKKDGGHISHAELLLCLTPEHVDEVAPLLSDEEEDSVREYAERIS